MHGKRANRLYTPPKEVPTLKDLLGKNTLHAASLMYKREVFDQIVEERIAKIREVLVIKGVEYQRGDDVLHNFKRGALLSGQIPERVLWGFALKHYISFLDILDDVEKGILPTEDKLSEKIGDLINYLILMETSIKDKIWHTETKI